MADRKTDLDALVQETMAITKSILVEPPNSGPTKFDSALRTSRSTKNASYGNERTSRRPC